MSEKQSAAAMPVHIPARPAKTVVQMLGTKAESWTTEVCGARRLRNLLERWPGVRIFVLIEGGMHEIVSWGKERQNPLMLMVEGKEGIGLEML